MLLLRLCPLIPFNGLNYIGGITSVSWEEFTMALIGTLPLQLLLVIMGATTQSMMAYHPTEEQRVGLKIVIFSGIAFGIFGLILLWRLCKRQLQEVRSGFEISLSFVFFVLVQTTPARRCGLG